MGKKKMKPKGNTNWPDRYDPARYTDVQVNMKRADMKPTSPWVPVGGSDDPVDYRGDMTDMILNGR